MMRSLEETRSRWQATAAHSGSRDQLQLAVRGNGPASPCLLGCRSICWKAFVLSTEASESSWTQTLLEGRKEYDQQRERFLRFIEHPETLNQSSVDPLTDDPASPWNMTRQDDAIRAEIWQDVQRLPDEAKYHDDVIQLMILNILFVYCKRNSQEGGYRQGMHELLAPLVYVVERDAVDVRACSDFSLDGAMLIALDSAYIEHDAYLLFSRLMDHAKSSYEIRDATHLLGTAEATAAGQAEQWSAIVERSIYIHQDCLRKVDEELASHLSSIEILPQIFLIRWIRLLFSREFPLDQVLVLWDNIFAVDASLGLVDFICCAMLLRIRWKLLEADYTSCLQLLLRYPCPEAPNGPQTFVDDAIFLRDHSNSWGGAFLIEKYTGKKPQGRMSLPRQGRIERPSLSSPSRSIFQSVSVDNLLQGAAKGARGVLERGDKLGISHAVREAVVEIRRNMQNLQEARRPTRATLNGERAVEALEAMERRNKQLARLLGEAVESLEAASRWKFDDASKSGELIEIATAKVQFAKAYLGESGHASETELDAEGIAEEAESGRSADAAAEDGPGNEEGKSKNEDNGGESRRKVDETGKEGYRSDLDADETLPQKKGLGARRPAAGTERKRDCDEVGADDDGGIGVCSPVGLGAMPTRSRLAQSSFSWMLEPNEDAASQFPKGTKRWVPEGEKKASASGGTMRDRNSFLFGDGMAETEGKADAGKGDIFGMEPVQRWKSRT